MQSHYGHGICKFTSVPSASQKFMNLALIAKPTKPVHQKNALLPGEHATILSISTASTGGSKQDQHVPLTTKTGNLRGTETSD